MPTEASAAASRRVFRLALTSALALAVAYALATPVAFVAPILAWMLTAPPGPPIAAKSVAGLLALIAITSLIGFALVPLLLLYPLSALLVAAAGVYACTYLSVSRGQALAGTLLTVGFTLIPAAGTVHFVIATTVAQALVASTAIAAICQRLVYPLFPEVSAPAPVAVQERTAEVQSDWIALRTTLILLPPLVLLLIDPMQYSPIIMKTVLLAQQASIVATRSAGRELVGSTLLSGIAAVVLWFLLGMAPNLWMFFLLTLVFGIVVASRLYGVHASRYSAAFWQNVFATTLILLGPALEDSAQGRDVYEAFAVRMSLFVCVALYAWAAVRALDNLRTRRRESTVTNAT
jgi:hypothetical protein